jgi:hypothetical protein
MPLDSKLHLLNVLPSLEPPPPCNTPFSEATLQIDSRHDATEHNIKLLTKFTRSLAQWMYEMYVHWSVSEVDKYSVMFSSVSVCLLDRSMVPISPIHPFFKKRYCKDVWNRSVHDSVTISSVDVSISSTQ